MRLGRDDTGRWKITPDRYEDVGRMKISRPLIWAFRVTLILLWLALGFHNWMIAGVP